MPYSETVGIYTYSLREGIEDGFLAPYRFHRVVTTWNAAGWRPSKSDLDRYGPETGENSLRNYLEVKAVVTAAG